jgi:hypothetical protein
MLPVRWPPPFEPPVLLLLWKIDPLLPELELSPPELELLPLEELEELEEPMETAAPPVPVSAPRCCAKARAGTMPTHNAMTSFMRPPSLVLYYLL